MNKQELEQEKIRSNGAESITLPISKWKEILQDLEMLEILKKYAVRTYDYPESKVALDELRTVLITNQGTKEYTDIFEKHLLKPIEKDLEVLEIIKKYLEIVDCESYEDGCRKIVLEIPDQCLREEDDEGNEDVYPINDFYEIEEWLNNDK